MHPLATWFLTLALAASPLRGEPLADRLQALLDGPGFRTCHVGVHVVSLDTGKTLFAHDAGAYFVPASNAKLFACALALCRLGPDRRFRTTVRAAGRPGADGVLVGDLTLAGGGDPMLMARWRGGPGVPEPLETLADQVAGAGVKVVAGDLVGDDSAFRTRPFGSGWEVEDLAFAFGAEVSALTVHDNMIELRIYPGLEAGRPCLLFPVPGLGLLPLVNLTGTGPAQPLRAIWTAAGLEVTGRLPAGAAPAALAVPVREPARFAAILFRRALERRGITVRGTVRAAHAGERPTDGPAALELAQVESLPVREIVRATLKDSVNLYAQMLLLQAGGSEAAGLAALAEFLGTAGIARGVRLEEGSGLSRKDLVTPEAVTALLAFMARQPEAAAFRDALPMAGVDGTLRSRFLGTPAAARIAAKTGTLRYTHALSGYATSAAGERVAFSILLNNYVPEPGGPDGPAQVDALAALLAGDEGPQASR